MDVISYVYHKRTELHLECPPQKKKSNLELIKMNKKLLFQIEQSIILLLRYYFKYGLYIYIKRFTYIKNIYTSTTERQRFSISNFIADMHVEIWWSTKICLLYKFVFYLCTITQFFFLWHHSNQAAYNIKRSGKFHHVSFYIRFRFSSFSKRCKKK